MKKGDVIRMFLTANNLEIGSANAYTKEVHAAYNTSIKEQSPQSQCSYQYFKNVASGTFVSNYNASAIDVVPQPNMNFVTPIFNSPEQFNMPNMSAVALEEEVYETKRASEINFSEDVLIPVPTGEIIDELISYSGGFMPATIMMVPGESGSGKTTLLLKLFGMVKEQNPEKDVCFISSEMNSIHIYKYKQRINFEHVEVCVLSESSNPWNELRSTLARGWDLVLIDSLADTIGKLRTQLGWTEKEAENRMLKLMDEIRRGQNDKQKYTTFCCTHHMTKGGTYTGSTNLKHMTDSMMELIVEDDKSYIEFSKNRDGKKGIKLYYDITNSGINFDIERYQSDKEAREKISRTSEILKEKSANFEKIFFGKTPQVENEEVEIEVEITHTTTLENQVVTSVVLENIEEIEDAVVVEEPQEMVLFDQVS